MTKQPITKSNLITWIWHRPLQFTFLTLGTTFGIYLLYFWFAHLFLGGVNMISPIPLFLLLFINTILCIRWLIKKLPNENLDYTSFMNISIAQNFVYIACFLVMTLGITLTGAYGAYFASNILLLIFSTFVISASIVSIYTTFCRMRKLGVPTWKFILSIPFGTLIFWSVGYITKDKPIIKTPIVQTKKTWFNNLISWVIATPSHLAIALIFEIAMAIFMDVSSGIMLAWFLGIYAIALAIWGADKMRKHLGSTTASIAVILNIAIILSAITFGFVMARNTTITTTSTNGETISETITISEQ